MMHPQKFASKLGLDYSGKIGPSEVLGGSSSKFSPTQLASAFAAIANGGTYNNAHSIQKVVTHEGDTIEYEHTSHKAMKDYTSYMLAEILKGTFKAYGSAYGHGVSGVNMGAKTGVLVRMDKKYTKSIIYLIMLPKMFGLMVSVRIYYVGMDGLQ